jgi:hypothetical protein
MLLVLETIQEHNLQILLARETFDRKLAPLKAWVAQMELEGMRERMTMGVKARWVRQVCEWYIQSAQDGDTAAPHCCKCSPERL